MKSVTQRRAAVVLCGVLLLFCSCSSDDSGTNSTTETVAMTGAAFFPNPSAVDYSDITVSFGENETPIGDGGAFEVSGNQQIPGVAIAYDRDAVPLLMRIIPNPQADVQIPLDARSTALSLVYLSPLVCVGGEATDAQEVLDALKSLDELDNLESVVQTKLMSNPRALASADSDLANAVSTVILAYLRTFPSLVARNYPGATQIMSAQTVVSTDDKNVWISPTTPTSGLLISHASDDTYEISNAYGRFATVWVPKTGEKFMVTPNGTMLGFIRDGLPWAPSKATFTMPLSATDDSTKVHIYGYGMSNVPGSYWDDLTEDEIRMTHTAGLYTIIMEFVGNTVSVCCNTASGLTTQLNTKFDVGRAVSLTNFLLSDVHFMEQVTTQVREGRYGDLAWNVVQKVIDQIITDEAYRSAWYKATGNLIGNSVMKKLQAWVATPIFTVPIVGITIGSKFTQIFNAEVGLLNARLKTTFTMWIEVEDFGGVEGQVADKSDGVGIEGATVTITPDANNPLDPSYSTTTDAGGYYSLANIGVGEKTISASKSGYSSASQTVTIEKNTTITVDFTLEKQSGGVSGRVLNDIYIQNSLSPQEFQGSIEITARQIGGEEETRYTTTNNGQYSLSLPVGTWWVIAAHDDYAADSFSIAVSSEDQITAPRNLVLKPITSLSGTMYFDINADGSYEANTPLEFPTVGLEMNERSSSNCIAGSPMNTILGGGIRGSSENDYDLLFFGFNSDLITDAGAYAAGGIDQFGCNAWSIPALVILRTTRYHCSAPWLQEDLPLTFMFIGDPDDAGCNCGIGAPGTIYLTEWGTEPGAIIAGSMVVDLASWRGCECSGNDTDGDGMNDEWDVECARVQLDFHFRMHVGTEYLIPWTPDGFDPAAMLSPMRINSK